MPTLLIQPIGYDGNGVGNLKGWLYKGTIGWGRNKGSTMPRPTRGYLTGVNW